MDKVILVNKDKGYTSRDVVNIVSKKLQTKKVGHFGTLDPLASGLLVLGVGALTKLDNFDIFDTKKYIAEVLVGVSTDTYDITGNIIDKRDVLLDKDDLVNALESFNKTYMQEVPIYSAVKVNGKKLYEYARNNISVELPKKMVTIKDMKLVSFYNKDGNSYFKFSCTVSKGTYIRSIINDLSHMLNVPLCMFNLIRESEGKFNLKNANTIDDIKNGNINMLDITDVLNVLKMEITDSLEKKVLNGNVIDYVIADYVLFMDNGKNIALYKKEIDHMKFLFFFKN